MTRPAVLLYRLLLLAFPASMRRDVGAEMTRIFEQQLDDARRRGDGTAAVWCSAAADALRHGMAERWVGRATTGRKRGTHAMRQDLRYALRLLASQPGLTLVAIATLALGIGANAAIFSAVNAVLLRPLPYPDADRLGQIWEKRPSEGVMDNVVSPADYLDWEERQQTFEAIAAHTAATADLTGSGEPIRLATGAVSPAFFDVLGVRMALGRTFRPEEATVGQHQVAILSHALWRDRFSADPAIVGRKILLNAEPVEVVGVLPLGFEFSNRSLELWVPLALRGGAQPQSRTNHYLTVYGRLKRGVSLEQGRADMNRLGAALQTEFPEANRNHGAHVVSLAEEQHGPVRQGLLALVAAVGLVLLIACVNVANLLLAKAASRRREMAIRAAVGASRSRLIGQALVESVVLAMAGGAAALLVAALGIRLLRQITPQHLQVLGADRVALDLPVLGFTLALSLVTGLVFGILPAWQLSGQDVHETLKEGGRSPGGARRRLRTSLVVAEIALASLLLVGAGLTLRSFQALLHIESGFESDRRLTAFVSLPAARYRTDAQRVAAYDEIEARFAALPGVTRVGATSHLPVAGADSRTAVAIEGRPPTPDAPTRAHPRAVTLDYFGTMGIRLLEGRNFTAADHSESQFVVIVNETMAKRYWPGESPVGKRLRMGVGKAWREVVGVVADVHHWGFDRPVNPEMYLPQRQMVWDGLTYILATNVDPASLIAAVRSALGAVDPDLPLSNVQTMDAVAARSVATRRSTMVLLVIFGMLALALAAAGIYGVMAQLVAQRSGEIGVRLALGARPGGVMRLVLREGLLQAAVGLAIGLTAGVLVMRAFDAALFRVRPADPLTLAGVAALLVGTALLACMIPARRAMRTDPARVLRA